MKKGFTLIETLIYIALFGLVISSFTLFSLNISANRNKTYSILEVSSGLRDSLDYITKTIRRAEAINFTDSVFNTNFGILSLEMASSTENPTIFSVNNETKVLEVKQGSFATTTLTPNEIFINKLIFENLTGSSTKTTIKIKIGADYIASSSIEFNFSETLETSVSKRK